MLSNASGHLSRSERAVPVPFGVSHAKHESSRSSFVRCPFCFRHVKWHQRPRKPKGRVDGKLFRPNDQTATAVNPLPQLKVTGTDEFTPLLQEIVIQDLSEAELIVLNMFNNQKACVKTLRNCDWTPFLQRFLAPVAMVHQNRRAQKHNKHDDIPPHDNYPFNSFMTSTTLLPENGKKMRAFGSTNEYTIGAVFALPTDYDSGETETQVVKRTKTWAWPSGYAAKTEFNIDNHEMLIHGRQEALVSLETLRQSNCDYVTKKYYAILGRVVKGGDMQPVPYNEVFLRVGGVGHIVKTEDTTTRGNHCDGEPAPSLEYGVGLPVAFFVRTATYRHLISLLRTRARAAHVLQQSTMKAMPLLLVTPELGTRVFTANMERQLLKVQVHRHSSQQ